MTCASCGTDLAADAVFCPNCGARKGAPAAPAARTGTLTDQGTVAPGGGPGGSAGRLAPGTRFADRYEIKSVLGEGSMGVVYLATDTNTGDDVVVKLVHPNVAASETAVKRLMTEGKTARQIRHPNIVAVFDVAQHGGQPYFTMEYVEGGTLRSWMVRQKQSSRDVPLDVAVHIVRAILAGLAEAHRSGVVHRDLKPENVLVSGDPGAADFKLKVLDFGIARGATGGTADGGGFAGTIGYMAPEQKTAADVVGPEADFWSLSVMFYELLMENPPQTRWEPVSRARPDVPAAIDTLLERGMSTRPKSRYASAASYGSALDAAIAQVAPEPITPEPRRPDPPPPPPGPSWLAKLQQQWAALSTTAKVATVAGVIAAGAFAAWEPDSPPFVEVNEETREPQTPPEEPPEEPETRTEVTRAPVYTGPDLSGGWYHWNGLALDIRQNGARFSGRSNNGLAIDGEFSSNGQTADFTVTNGAGQVVFSASDAELRKPPTGGFHLVYDNGQQVLFINHAPHN